MAPPEPAALVAISACTPPARALPPGAWDCHSHVFGMPDAYPLLSPRRYDPPFAPGEGYLAMLDTVGFAHGVIVHPSAYGYDNSCTADAIALAAHRLSGVAVVDPAISDAQLEALDVAGFRSIRFTVTPRARAHEGSLDFDDLDRLAPRMRALGWYADIWATCDEIVAAGDRLAGHGLPVMIDHMGYFDVAAGIDAPLFRSYLALLRDGDFWIKTTPIRLVRGDPTAEAIRPFHDILLETLPDRAVFGSDWPYLSMDDARPDTGRLVDLFDAWTPDDALRQRIFVDNPDRFFARR